MDDLTKILYINITPKGTFIYNVTNLENENKLVANKIKANKATMASRKIKIEKGVRRFLI